MNRKPYKTKALLDARGKLVVKVKIFDKNNKWSTEIGEATNSNLKRQFKITLNDAVLNAIYKHFWKRGKVVPKYDEGAISDEVKRIKIIDYNIFYYSDRRYSYKRVTKNNKYYIETRRDGKFHKLDKVKYNSNKRVNELNEMYHEELEQDKPKVKGVKK